MQIRWQEQLNLTQIDDMQDLEQELTILSKEEDQSDKE
jgi:hypothetical protein